MWGSRRDGDGLHRFRQRTQQCFSQRIGLAFTADSISRWKTAPELDRCDWYDEANCKIEVQGEGRNPLVAEGNSLISQVAE